jgi:NAD(P)-dependent dehydrogenase (short-subunit alcohol dehydrogenase family)
MKGGLNAGTKPLAIEYANSRIHGNVVAPGICTEMAAYLGDRVVSPGGGSLDHISMRCLGLADYHNRLGALGLPFQERVVPELSEHQLFVEDPNGIKIELLFPYSPDNKILGDNLGRMDAVSPVPSPAPQG